MSLIFCFFPAFRPIRTFQRGSGQLPGVELGILLRFVYDKFNPEVLGLLSPEHARFYEAHGQHRWFVHISPESS